MATQILIDEKHITNAHVYITGEKLSFVSLSINQAFGQHHTFSLVLDYDSMKKNFLSSPLEQIELMGKLIDIELQQGNDNGNAYEFRGIISTVVNESREGKHGFLIVEGTSPTIMLERGKRLDVFSNMSLQQVFEEVTDGIAKKYLSCVNKPAYESTVPFLMQYHESDWEFLQRLSAISGETLFYTGKDLVFGQYKDWSPGTVVYDKEITDIRFGSRLLPNTFTRYQYLAEQDDTIEQSSPNSIENSNEYIDTATKQSHQITETRPLRTPVELPVEDKGSLDELVIRQKTSTAAQTIYIEGKSKTCDPRIGRLLKIKIPEGMSDAGELGTYRIIKVRHSIDQNHRYRCEFEAVPAGLKFIPVPELKKPLASSLVGLVIKNDDPQNQGRVAVEFPFARNRVSDTWIRVMTPNAGSSNEVSKNRGMVFIPEKGDQVMIGFEFGDPNRPYVMGSMFHAKNGQGGGIKNAIKSISTRSGIKIIFNDDDKSLHIEDPSGNTWDMDGKGTIALHAPKNISIIVGENIDVTAGKNITIHAKENISISAGKNINESAEGNINQSAVGTITETSDNRTEIIENDYVRDSKKSDHFADEINIISTKENITVQSAKSIKWNSAEKSNIY